LATAFREILLEQDPHDPLPCRLIELGSGDSKDANDIVSAGALERTEHLAW
jgi:hypothetical protein